MASREWGRRWLGLGLMVKAWESAWLEAKKGDKTVRRGDKLPQGVLEKFEIAF
jgi:hypothetical protein